MTDSYAEGREAIAGRLRAVREVLSLNKKDFAERAGLSEQSYGPYENARRDISLYAARRMQAWLLLRRHL